MRDLVIFLNQSPELVNQTTVYLRIETIAIPLRVIIDMVFIALVLLNFKKSIYIFLFSQLAIRFFSDYLFIGQNTFNMGVIGVGYSTVTINVVTAIVGFLLFFREFNLSKIVLTTKNTDWKMKWLKISLYSGLESGVRNIAFVGMILKLVNEVQELDIFWITNNFIWGWLLLPILALGTLIKQDVGNHNGVIGDRLKGYFLLSFICVLLWIISIPLWNLFIENVMNIKDFVEVSSLALIMLDFYIIFAFNNVFDSYLYGMGRTDLMLYQALFVNGVYYVLAYIFYLNEIFVPTLNSIALLFGFGIVLDFLATVFLFKLAKYPMKSYDME